MVNDLEKKRKEKKKKKRLVERSFLFTMQCAHRGVNILVHYTVA